MENDDFVGDCEDSRIVYDEITELREDILYALMKPNEKQDSCEIKESEQPFLHSVEYYEEKVCVDIDAMDLFAPELEFVETKSQLDLWRFFRRHTSSVKTHTNIGRNIKILVKDSHSKKYIGILAIGSDIFYCADRDKAIGWKSDQIKTNIHHIVNIWGCVGLQPLSYNYNIGKLLTSLCFSREVLNYYEMKYGVKIAAFTTFGAFGKAIQYERLPYIKLVGFTKGFNSNRIPDELYDKTCQLYCKIFGVSKVCERNGRLDNLICLFKWLGISKNLLQQNGTKRGVYLGYTTPQSQDFLLGKVDSLEWPESLPTVKSIGEWWRERWAKPRMIYLKDSNRFLSTGKPRWTWEPLRNNKLVYQRRLYNFLPIHEYELTQEHIDALQNIQLSPSYIAGLIDGDGTIGFYNSQCSVYISISQCDPRPLLILQKMYGGTIRLKMPRTQQERKQYCYTLNKNTQPLLHILANHCILKSKRAVYCYEVLYGSLEGSSTEISKNPTKINMEEHERIVKNIIDLQKDYIPIDNDYKSRLNIEYIAGLFDAEGFIGASGMYKKYNGFTITITQKSNPVILEEIRDYLGYGKTTNPNYRWMEFSSKNIEHFLTQILPYLIVKKEQAEALMRFQKIPMGCKNKTKTEIKTLQEYKHREYKISIEILLKSNQEGKIKCKSWRPPKCIKAVKPKEKQQRASKGVPLKESHRVNISYQLSKSQQTITDDMIDNVRGLKDTYRQTTISKLLNISRCDVYKIIHGLVVKKDELTIELKQKQLEEKRKRATLSKEVLQVQCNINRRKIPLERMVWVLKKIQEPYESQTSVYEKLKEEMIRNNEPVRFTVTPVIHIIDGKTRPYDSEFPLLGSITKEEYEGWLKNIQTIDFKKSHKVQMGIKVRSISPESIVKVYLKWKACPTMTRTALANEFEYKLSTLRRFLDHPDLYYPCDFPVTIDGNTYSYQDYLDLVKMRSQS